MFQRPGLSKWPTPLHPSQQYPLYLCCSPCLRQWSRTLTSLSSAQPLSRVRLFATPWTAAPQASLSITNSWSSLRLTPIESVMPSSHLILCCPLLLLPPIPPSIKVFSNEPTLHMRWPKYWSFSFSIIPSMNTQDWSPLEWTGWISLQSKGLSPVYKYINTQLPQMQILLHIISHFLPPFCPLAPLSCCQKTRLQNSTPTIPPLCSILWSWHKHDLFLLWQRGTLSSYLTFCGVWIYPPPLHYRGFIYPSFHSSHNKCMAATHGGYWIHVYWVHEWMVTICKAKWIQPAHGLLTICVMLGRVFGNSWKW